MNIKKEIKVNYTKWKGWSERRWNGAGEDVIQDTLILLWEKILRREAHFTDPQALSAWVLEAIIKKGKDTNQGRRKIVKNSTSLESLQDKGFEPAGEKEEEKKKELGDVWERGQISYTKSGRIRDQKNISDLPLFLQKVD